MKHNHLASIIFVVSILAAARLPQGTRKPDSEEQSHFDVEYEYGAHPIVHPINIRKDILEILRTDKRRVLVCAKSKGISADQIPGDWFVGSVIHLDGPNERDLFVQPRFDLDLKPSNRCLFGANIGPFWLFRITSTGYQLILDTDAHDLIALSTRTNGFRDVELESATATMVSTTIFKFDGRKYEPGPSNWELIH